MSLYNNDFYKEASDIYVLDKFDLLDRYKVYELTKLIREKARKISLKFIEAKKGISGKNIYYLLFQMI